MEAGGFSLVSQGLGWLGLAYVPLLVFLMLALLLFGTTGLLVQYAAASIFDAFLPTVLVALASLGVTVPALRAGARALGRVIPRDHSQAISEASFQGKLATIVLGTARRGHPTQARFRDAHGQTHYVLVEPFDDGRTLSQGEQVVLVERDGARFLAVSFEEALSPVTSPNGQLELESPSSHAQSESNPLETTHSDAAVAVVRKE